MEQDERELKYQKKLNSKKQPYFTPKRRLGFAVVGTLLLFFTSFWRRMDYQLETNRIREEIRLEKEENEKKM